MSGTTRIIEYSLKESDENEIEHTWNSSGVIFNFWVIMVFHNTIMLSSIVCNELQALTQLTWNNTKGTY